MGMKLTFLCCVAGELKDNIVGTTKNSRLFFYRAYEDQTITEMMEDGFFNGAQELRVDDLILLYDPNTKNEYEMVRIESMQGTVKTKKVDLPDIKKIYQILKEHQEEIDHNAALIAELDADTVHKSNGIDTIYGRQTGNEFDYSVKNDFDGTGSKNNIPTTLGLAKSFKTPLSTDNKGASMAEIAKVEEKVNIAATSGNLIGSFWFGKTNAQYTPPLPTKEEQNYFDFTTNTPYTANADLSGWTAGTPIANPTVDSQIQITSKFWNIPEQNDQQGGTAYWSHINQEWSYSPKIISFESPNLTGIPTTPDITDDSPDNQIVNLKALRENSNKGASLPLLTRLISDYQLNDISYLNANTFSWQPGATYSAAYQHLVDDLKELYIDIAVIVGHQYRNPDQDKTVDGVHYYNFGAYYTITAVPHVGDSFYMVQNNTATEVPIYKISAVNGDITETIEGITITCFQSGDKHKICDPSQETAISELYAKTGEANLYILDTQTQRFKLPRTKKRRPIRAVKNADGSWYNLYSDGWVEQGGGYSNTSNQIITLPIKMSNSNYSVMLSFSTTLTNSPQYASLSYRNKTTTSFVAINAGSIIGDWQVSGYAASSVLANEPIEYEYYYVGNFTQTALENTAGITAEALNQKADVSAVPGLVMPDYGSGVVLGINTNITITENGVITGEMSAAQNAYCNVLINDNLVFQLGSELGQRCRSAFYAPVSKDDIVKLVISGSEANFELSKFYPYKGV